jgi:hypothetical protein
MCVFDALVASVSAGADPAESRAGFAGLTVEELEVAAVPTLSEAIEGGRRKLVIVLLELGRLGEKGRCAEEERNLEVCHALYLIISLDLRALLYPGED